MSKLSCIEKLQQVVTPKRNVVKEYAKKKSILRLYEVGDRVLVRRGPSEFFHRGGTVIKIIGIATFQVKFDDGWISTCNQFNMKPVDKFAATDLVQDIQDDAERAYDDATAAVEVPLVPVQVPDVQKTPMQGQRYPRRIRQQTRRLGIDE